MENVNPKLYTLQPPVGKSSSGSRRSAISFREPTSRVLSGPTPKSWSGWNPVNSSNQVPTSLEPYGCVLKERCWASPTQYSPNPTARLGFAAANLAMQFYTPTWGSWSRQLRRRRVLLQRPEHCSEPSLNHTVSSIVVGIPELRTVNTPHFADPGRFTPSCIYPFSCKSYPTCCCP